MRLRLAPYLENIGESGFACLLTMIQGNLAALTLSHWLVASETGMLAGAIAATTIIAARLRRPWVVSLTLGLFTVAADAIVHRASFGAASVIEALITGVGASVLSLGAGSVVRAIAATRRRAA